MQKTKRNEDYCTNNYEHDKDNDEDNDDGRCENNNEMVTSASTNTTTKANREEKTTMCKTKETNANTRTKTTAKKMNKKALLFIMVDDTKNCDDVEGYLSSTFPFLKNGIFVIHTKDNSKDATGEINENTAKGKEELQRLRRLVNTVDDLNSPIKVIISVLMLKEGWDVKNVTTIVGLRAYASHILPEQRQGPFAARLAERANQNGHGIMLHAPMANESGAKLGPGALTPDMDRIHLQQTLSDSLEAIPHVQGVNNHMGSLLTQQPEAARRVCRHDCRRSVVARSRRLREQ